MVPCILHHQQSTPITASTIFPSTSAIDTATTISAEHRRAFNYAVRAAPSFYPTTQLSYYKQAKIKFKDQKGSNWHFEGFFFAWGTLMMTNHLVQWLVKQHSQTVAWGLNSIDIHESLIKQFPLLSLAGGYELLVYQGGGIK